MWQFRVFDRFLCWNCRWFRADGTVGVSYLPKSPLSALPATAVLCGFSGDFMTAHALGRGLVAVPLRWIDALAPGALEAFSVVRSRNRSRTGKVDMSGEQAAASILHLVCVTCDLPKSLYPPPLYPSCMSHACIINLFSRLLLRFCTWCVLTLKICCSVD